MVYHPTRSLTTHLVWVQLCWLEKNRSDVYRVGIPKDTPEQRSHVWQKPSNSLSEISQQGSSLSPAWLERQHYKARPESTHHLFPMWDPAWGSLPTFHQFSKYALRNSIHQQSSCLVCINNSDYQLLDVLGIPMFPKTPLHTSMLMNTFPYTYSVLLSPHPTYDENAIKRVYLPHEPNSTFPFKMVCLCRIWTSNPNLCTSVCSLLIFDYT